MGKRRIWCWAGSVHEGEDGAEEDAQVSGQFAKMRRPSASPDLSRRGSSQAKGSGPDPELCSGEKPGTSPSCPQ